MTATTTEQELCEHSGLPVDRCHEPCHWCDMSDLHVYECALPCHRNEHLPPGLEPAEEPVRGVTPSGSKVWPPAAAQQHQGRDTIVTTSDPLGQRKLTVIQQHRRPRPKRTARCRYVPELDAWCTPEHTRECRSNLCQGCQPCEKDHCWLRGSCPNHVNHKTDLWTCPQCIGTVRAQIADIVEKAILVSAELEYVGVDSEAANLAGPAAAPEQLDARRTHVVQVDDQRGWCDYPMRPEIYGRLDRYHPYAVLARWELYFRDTAGAPNTKTITTITGAAAYLTGLLATKMPHRDAFEAFAKDVAKCYTHLEEVLSDSRRPETGAPCPKCADATRGTDRRAQRLVKKHDEGDRTGANDLWVCPDVPTHRWREADYRIRVAGDYLTNADRLTADHLRKQYGITPGNLRKWAERGQVHKRGRDINGRLLYDVREARQCEDKRRGWCDHPRVVEVYPIEREQVSA